MSKRFVFTGVLGVASSALIWVGCSGSVASTGSDAGTQDAAEPDTGVTPPADTGVDAPVVVDAAPEAAVDTGVDAGHQVLDSGPLMCGTMQCSANTECCAVASDAGVGGIDFQCLASCPDGGAPIQCTSPQQCPGASNVCCGTIDLTGTFPGCSFGAVSSACTTSCAINIALACPATEVVQFCAQKADCTDPNNGECCSVTYGGQTQTFCLSTADAQAAMGFGAATCLQ